MEKIIISFCITTYNQLNFVKSCIESIIPYKGNDIEIIVSDDGSTEDIGGLINSFNDTRIKFFKNQKNLGHDLNIINSFEKAKGEYAFLLRTRDQVIPDTIPHIIDFIKKHNNCSYITGNALDEKGFVRYSYNKEIIEQGPDTIHAHFNLYIHPSGSLYSLRKLRVQELKKFLQENIENKQAFVAHSMMRIQLAETGDFGFITKPMWRYIEPSEKDIAYNKAKGNVSVYDPLFLRQRFSYEIRWVKLISSNENYKYLVTNIFNNYLKATTWVFYFWNKNSKLQKHYSYKERPFSVKNEEKEFKIYSYNLIKECFGDSFMKLIKNDLEKKIRINRFFGWEKTFTQTILQDSMMYIFVRKIYRKIINSKL